MALGGQGAVGVGRPLSSHLCGAREVVEKALDAAG